MKQSKVIDYMNKCFVCNKGLNGLIKDDPYLERSELTFKITAHIASESLEHSIVFCPECFMGLAGRQYVKSLLCFVKNDQKANAEDTINCLFCGDLMDQNELNDKKQFYKNVCILCYKVFKKAIENSNFSFKDAGLK